MSLVVSRHAAIDVGSNSIRLLIAEMTAEGRLTPVHEDREVVRLGTAVFRQGRLGAGAVDRACRVLERMAAAIERHGVASMRAVGTSALRDASNRCEFILQASSILGTPLEVVGGLEEGRLVQRGVAVHWPHEHELVLIVDLGGGSVQLILSDRERFAGGASLPLGSVRLTEQFVASDPPRAGEMARLRLHIREQLAGAAASLARASIHRVIATSATARAVVCAVHGIKRSQRHHADGLGATAHQIGSLLELLTDRDVESRRDIPGIGRRRAEIIVAGVAVLDEIIRGLDRPAFQYSVAGVRDGIVSELAMREMAADDTSADLLSTGV